MSIHIKTLLRVDGGEYTLPLPQKQNDFDKYLTEAGILTGDRSEYEIIRLECNYSEIQEAISEMQDIEELNYLAQLLDGYSDQKLNEYAAIAAAKDDMSINGLIGLAFKLNSIDIYPSVTDFIELGRKYVDENYSELDELIAENLNYESLGEDVKLQELGEFTEAGYIPEFSKIFYHSKYDGASFPPYDYERDYSLKIRLCNGMTTDDGKDKYAEIMLPASDTVFARAMRRIEADNLDDCYISHFYSDRFRGMEQLFAPDESISELNILAEKMAQIPDEQIKEYKDAVAENILIGSVKNLTEFTDQFLSGQYQREKAQKDCKENTVRKLTASAVEMAGMFGAEALDDIGKLKDQVTDFVNRWNLDEHFIDQFDMEVAEAMPEYQPDETEDEESGMGMSMM